MTQSTLEIDSGDNGKARTQERATLNKERYTSRAFALDEWNAIWSKTWLFAGVVADIPDAGDYFVFELGRESIVVTRNDEGSLRAFFNVCQHRGNRLLSNYSGSVAKIACPYHGWRYDLDGVLQSIPDESRFAPTVNKAAHALKTVRIEQWAGLIWINMNPDAMPLLDYLGPIADELSPYRFEEMVLAKQQTVALNANWKTVRDNFLEQYHVDFIHPQHASLVDCCNSTNFLWPLGHSASQVEGYVTDSRYPVPQETPPHLIPLLSGLGLDPDSFNGKVETIREAVQKKKRELGAILGFDYEPLSDAQVSDVWQYDIFPNTFMTIQAEELWIFGPRLDPAEPDNPDRCLLDKWTLQIPVEKACDPDKGLTLNPSVVMSQNEERPQHEVFSAQDVIAGRHSLTITLDQDIYLLADMQAGMHSMGFDKAVLNQDEVRVQHFHDWIDSALAKLS